MCASELPAAARYCHVCGASRHGVPAAGPAAPRLGLGPLIAFLLGATCLLAAVATGVIFGASTQLDWEALQSWRTQWLLAAVAAFAAGILLKPARD